MHTIPTMSSSLYVGSGGFHSVPRAEGEPFTEWALIQI